MNRKKLIKKLEIPSLDDFAVINNKDYICLYRLRTKVLVNEEEYDILKEVLEDD